MAIGSRFSRASAEKAPGEITFGDSEDGRPSKPETAPQAVASGVATGSGAGPAMSGEADTAVGPHARTRSAGIRKTFNVERRLYDRLVDYQFDHRIRWESRVVNMALEEFLDRHAPASGESSD